MFFNRHGRQGFAMEEKGFQFFFLGGSMEQ
jgi:hypothetical protein